MCTNGTGGDGFSKCDELGSTGEVRCTHTCTHHSIIEAFLVVGLAVRDETHIGPLQYVHTVSLYKDTEGGLCGEVRQV